MRVKCANCGMVYDINVTSMDFRGPLERLANATCPSCKSNAKDEVAKETWRQFIYEEK